MNERTVELIVAAELEADFDKYRHLLPAQEISRKRNTEGTLLIVTVTAPETAPEQAATMSPWFSLVSEHARLGGIAYYDADGNELN